MPPPWTLPFTFAMPPELVQRLDAMEAQLVLLHTRQEALMTLGEDLKAELVKANETTNEIASDLDTVIAKLAESTDPAVQEALADLKVFNARLLNVAAKYTPEESGSSS